MDYWSFPTGHPSWKAEKPQVAIPRVCVQNELDPKVALDSH